MLQSRAIGLAAVGVAQEQVQVAQRLGRIGFDQRTEPGGRTAREVSRLACIVRASLDGLG
jgi:hypothetical protein